MQRKTYSMLRAGLFSVLLCSVVSATAGLMSPESAFASSPLTFPAATGLGEDSVSCTGATDCTALADDFSSVVTETNGAWGNAMPLSGPHSSAPGLTGIDCTSPSNCVAVGSPSGEASAWVEKRGNWNKSTAIPAPADGAFSWGSGVPKGSDVISCAVAGDCAAVGSIDLPEADYYAAAAGGFATGGSVVSDTSGTWGQPFLVLAALPSWLPAPQSASAGFVAISCPQAGTCTAVGTEVLDNGGSGEVVGIVATESAGSWSEAEPLYDTEYLNSVSCADATDCTAVGVSPSSSPLYISESNGSWGSATDLVDYQYGSFNGVSCPDATDCVAVGYSDSATQNTGAQIYDVESGGAWGPVQEIFEAGEPGFAAVSCVAVGICTTVGSADGIDVGESSSNTPSITVTDNAPVYHQTLTLTATVTGTSVTAPKGAVTWTVTDPQDVACTTTTGPVRSANSSTYTCSIKHATDGTYNATAAFAGDVNYASVSGSDQATVTGGAPSISSFSPGSGPKGTQITIDGSYLDNAKVAIDGVTAPILSDTDTEIVVTVPSTAKTGLIRVKTPSGSATTTTDFTVT